ncbi:MAG: hypothetical protein KGH75_03180 [Rhodospirillales bacterium]|nr:hypothetical protein [Rhodospirillales bacterium]
MKSLNLNQRKALAQIGHPQHLDKLVNDPSEYVRLQVAGHGNIKHLDKLVDDLY